MEKESENFKYIVRISNADLDGRKKVFHSILKIKGVGFTFANAICSTAQIDRTKRLGDLEDSEIKKIEDAISNSHKLLPEWMLNRRRGIQDDSSVHLVTSDLTFEQENNIRQMQRIRSYRGVRHMANAPVRGQRTRSNFRKNKGKVMGVAKTKSAPSKSSDKNKK